MVGKIKGNCSKNLRMTLGGAVTYYNGVIWLSWSLLVVFIEHELKSYHEMVVGLSLFTMQQRSNLVGTHSLSLTLQECFTHKYYYAQ